MSPDADELMTPNNILNMAMLKNLDYLAITDHNSTKQLKTIEKIEEAYDFILIPGVEVTVKENFDVLCYFRNYNDAHKLDSYIELHLNGKWAPFSESDQVITDIYDITSETFPKPLLSTSIPFKDLYKKVKELRGIIVLAHIDRKHKSALNSFKLEDIRFDGIEIQQFGMDEFLNANSYLNRYKILTSSDSHSLLTISEREYYLDLKEKSIEAFFKYFESGD